MTDFLSDIRYALRALRKSPAFTLVALVTLALGLGANLVVFGAVDTVLLHPLEVSHPENLYQLRNGAWTNWKLLTTSYPAFQDIRRQNTCFSDMAGFNGYCEGRLHVGDRVKNVSGYAVTGSYFDLLGVEPEIGRLIHSEDERGPNSAPYIVLSDQLWRNAFGADPGIVGRPVRLLHQTFTVIGVAPARFHGTEQFVWPDFYIPVFNFFTADYLRDRTGRPLTVLGRLKPGVTVQQATENLSAISGRLAKAYPSTDTGLPWRLVRPGLYADTGDVIRAGIYSVAALALLVLLAACANLAALFTARAADRSRELAVRLAVGATRWRIARQILTESLVLSLLGGFAGLTIAAFSLRFFGNLNHSPVLITVDSRIYLAALLLTLLSGLFFGMVPARNAWRLNLLPAMKRGRADFALVRKFTLRDLLLGAQIVICALLITASLVALRGMVRALHAPLGFQPQGALAVDMDFSELERTDVTPAKDQAMIEALRGLPGVVSVGTSSTLFFSGGRRGLPVFPPGTTDFALKNSVLSPLSFTISPGYFEAARTRLLRGRDFSWHDTADSPDVAIVNETFARKMWGDAPPIGQMFILLGHLREVVGVVEDGKYLEIQEPPLPVIFLPLSQSNETYPRFVVRSDRPSNEMVPAIAGALNALEPNVPVTVQSMQELVAGQLFPARAATMALGVLGFLAAMLTLTGIGGLAAYNVSRRMKEFGIRAALGARTRHLLNAAIGKPMALLGLGSLIGLTWGILAGRLLGQIVHQADPQDPVVLTGAILTMTLLGVAASALPALRALAVDPSDLLREE